MKKYIVGFFLGVVCAFAGLFITVKLLPPNTENVEECIDDTTYIDPALFLPEQKTIKRVQGDYTLE